ncbi:hypothetical protein HDU91_007389 [Kappamyces sp. JEL0680]|nr:hypothetical protein HDU91_007389 [Kappamyces sp. JEL0680]
MNFKTILFFAAPFALAYGRTGHSLSGAIAQELLTPAAKSFVESLLPEFGGQLSKIASWADEIKGDHSYDWAKPLHYINPVLDDPPRVCAYNPATTDDCPNSVCVVAAIHNFTNQLTTQSDLAVRKTALKFLIHFIGDLAQPLHATGRQRGGTQAYARFQGKTANLHSIWDYMMFEKRIKEDFGSDDAYIHYIVKQIGTAWRADVQEWLSCPTSDQLVLALQDTTSNNIVSFQTPDSIPTLVCPEKWAAYSNKVNCETVWPGYKRKYELSGDYYQAAIKVEEMMLAQAAVRMAAILDYIATM